MSSMRMVMLLSLPQCPKGLQVQPLLSLQTSISICGLVSDVQQPQTWPISSHAPDGMAASIC